MCRTETYSREAIVLPFRKIWDSIILNVLVKHGCRERLSYALIHLFPVTAVKFSRTNLLIAYEPIHRPSESSIHRPVMPTYISV